MPTEPNGEKSPIDVIGNAVRVMRIAAGEKSPIRERAWQEACAILNYERRAALIKFPANLVGGLR